MKQKQNPVIAFLVVGGFCGGFVLMWLIFCLVVVNFPVATFAAIAALVAAGVVVHRKRNRGAWRRLTTWVSAGGWIPVPADRKWPWASLLRMPGTVVVDRAWTATVDGFPVTAGTLLWDDNALDGAVVGWAGCGIFVVVRLPAPTEPMAMRRPHRTVGDSHRLDRPALHDAFENGEIPPWTARDRDLFTFQAIAGRLHPEHLDDLVRRTLLVVRLLDLGPDAASSVAAGGRGAGQVEGGVGRRSGDGRGLGESRGG
jgi:hypothetical protein